MGATGALDGDDADLTAGSLPVDLRNLSSKSETAKSCDDILDCSCRRELCFEGVNLLGSCCLGSSGRGLCFKPLRPALPPLAKFGLMEHKGSFKTKIHMII